MAGTTDVVLETFRRYVDAFGTLRPEAVVPYYHEPCLFIAPQGVWVLQASADVVAFFTKVMADLKGDGYATSAFSELEALPLGKTLAMVKGVGVWKRADGTELRRFGVAYTLCESDTGWRIVTAAVYAR